MKYTPIPLEVSLDFRYLHQELGTSLRQLKELYPQYPKASIYQHMKKPMAAVSGRDKPGGRGGRTRKGTERDKRKIVSALLKLQETEVNLTSRDIQREAGIPENQLSTHTLQRYLKEMGYGYKQCR